MLIEYLRKKADGSAHFLGQDGWMLVTVVYPNTSAYTTHLFFMRPFSNNHFLKANNKISMNHWKGIGYYGNY